MNYKDQYNSIIEKLLADPVLFKRFISNALLVSIDTDKKLLKAFEEIS